MTLRRILAAPLLSGALAVSLVGCGSSPEENAQDACAAYETFTQSVTQATTSLSASSTIEEITDARDAVQSAYTDLDAALDNVSQDRRQALADAWESFNDAVSDTDDSLTVPEAVASLRDEVANLETARAALGEDLTC